jgi:hypothetical protein
LPHREEDKEGEEMIKIIIKLTMLFTIVSCANTRTIYKDFTYPAKIAVKGKYKSIEIVEIASRGGARTFEERILGENYIFETQSFRNILEETLINNTVLDVIHRTTSSEVLQDRVARRDIRQKRGDLSVYGVYEEIQGEEAYSQDEAGQRSRMVFAHGRFTYKVVETSTGKILYTDTLSHKRRDNLLGSDVKLAKTTSETLGRDTREYLARNFSKIFTSQTVGHAFSFKGGEKDKFSKVIELVQAGKFDSALEEQKRVRGNIKDSAELSDSYYNEALIYILKKDKKFAHRAALNVENGFIDKDFDNIRKLINSRI